MKLYSYYIKKLGKMPMFLDRYLYTPCLLRLKKVNYFCGMDNASKEIYNFEEKSPDELEGIIHNSNKKIYFVEAWGNTKINNTNLTQTGQIAGSKFYCIDGKDIDADVYYTDR